eukprot:CAMPEP_0167799690 /NCGR_PEP_ID=MMETSP0111_2-20121227/17220_1 /TAXON_ID=91324 /ORGANISM="Lotharella globosa, Strain CCCM811" /LENGTH=606 /DNA_ID=CAMNT_0007694675 /DNA_START=24 /DNA_END=1841 /DNA_ORIENTATION=+
MAWYAVRGRKGKGAKKKRKSRDPLKRILRLALKTDPWPLKRVVIAIPAGVASWIYLSRAVNTRFGTLATCVMRRDWDSTFVVCYELGLLMLPLVSAEATLGYLTDRLGEMLRTRMEVNIRKQYLEEADLKTQTRLKSMMGSLTKDSVYLSRSLADVYRSIVTALSHIIAKPVLLGMHMGWKDFSVLMGYEMCMRGFVLRRLLPSLDVLSKTKADNEGKLSNANGYVAGHVAEIALIGGEGERESEILGELSRSVGNANAQYANEDLFPETLRLYLGSKLGHVVAFITMIPAVYYASDGRTRTGQDPLLYLTNAVHDLVDLGKSIGLLFRQLSVIDELHGTAQRLVTIPDAVSATRSAPSDTSSSSAWTVKQETMDTWAGGVEVKDLSIPSFETDSDAKTDSAADAKRSTTALLEGVTFHVKKGEKLLIRGENGVGKSTLLRLLSGRCGITATKGHVTRPPPEASVFLPARNYFPPNSTLRAQLAYPKPQDAYTMEAMKDALKHMGLLERLNDQLTSDQAHDWSLLSSGEQRKIQLARVLLAAPKIAFLDEPLASVRGLKPLEALFAKVGTCVVVSHNQEKEFEALHDSVLEIHGDGSTTFISLRKS